MARASRLVLPGLAHLVLLRGHDGTAIVRDDADAAALVDSLRLLAQDRELEVLGFRLQSDRLYLLLRPLVAESMSRALQWLGRRYVAAFNRRHGRSGTLWDGRFRAAVLEPGDCTLQVLHFLDQVPRAEAPLADSAESRLGDGRLDWLRQPAEYWGLGNTPFEREQAWRARVDEPVPEAVVERVHAALRSGRVFGAAAFVDALARQLQRPLALRRPGRPRRAVL